MPRKKAKKKGTRKKKKEAPVGLRIELTLLKKVPENKEFILCDGKKLSNIKDLALVLDEISDDVFWHHVSDGRNDFASWIEHVFEEKELAECLKDIKDRIETQRAVLKHIVKRIQC